VDDALDTGDVIASSEVEISPLDTPDSLLTKLHLAGANTLAEAVSAIESGRPPAFVRRQAAESVYQAHRTADHGTSPASSALAPAERSQGYSEELAGSGSLLFGDFLAGRTLPPLQRQPGRRGAVSPRE